MPRRRQHSRDADVMWSRADDGQRLPDTSQTASGSTLSRRRQNDDSGRRRSSRAGDEEDERHPGSRSPSRGDEGRAVSSSRSLSDGRRRRRSQAADTRALLGYLIHQVRGLTGRRSPPSHLSSAVSPSQRVKRLAAPSPDVDKRSSPPSPRRSDTNTFPNKLKTTSAASGDVSPSPLAVGFILRSPRPVSHTATAGSTLTTLLRASRDGWTSITDLQLFDLRLLLFDLIHM